jgi:hypothetical protein
VCAADGLSATCPVTAGTPGTEVCGNGIDEDCDGLADDDCLPTPLAPPNGFLTGSGRTISVAGQYNPRQVTFRWAVTTPGATYQIDIDNDANFSSPYVSTTTSATSYTSGDLLITVGPPMGTRYYWRVRSRLGQAAWSAWSTSRYVDVGRLPDDTNGDGYADVAVGSVGMNSPVTSGGAVYIYHGHSTGLPSTSPSKSIFEFGGQTGAHFGAAHAFADLDGDGYSDLIVGIPDRKVGTLNGVGQLAIYFGSATGVPTGPSMTIPAPVNQAYANFGSAVASAGDVDGDGYGDVWVGAPNQSVMIYWNGRVTMQPYVGAAYLYRGGPRGSISSSHADSRVGNAPNGFFGATIAAAGDVDGDGTIDMAFAAYSAGTVFVYRGGSPTVLAFLTRPGTNGFGRSIAAGDFDADGGVDLAISTMSPAGYVILRKSGSTFSSTPWYVDTGGGSSGDAQVASGDIDRDGDADLVVGYPLLGSGGQVVVFRGGSSFTSLGHWNETQAGGELGRGVTVADTTGDARADVFAGAPRCNVGFQASHAGKMLAWSEGASPTFGQYPTGTYGSPYSQVDAFFGNPLH